MSRTLLFSLFYLAVFLQAGAYGLTFLLPDLFAGFGADEKAVGQMLVLTAISTLITVIYSGHLSDRLGRVATLSLGCVSIAMSMALYAVAQRIGVLIPAASVALGAGWGLTYALAPVVLARLVDQSQRVRAFAMLSIFVMAGFGLSPVMAAAVMGQGAGVATAFGITAVLCLISAALFAALIPGLRGLDAAHGTEPQARLCLASLGAVLRSPARLPLTMVCLGASVFAGMNNFQTVFAAERSLDYAVYFSAYTATVVAFRIALTRFSGGSNPYLTIAVLQYVMAASVVLFIAMGASAALYVLVAVLFGIGYGASYPILVAMAANDARPDLVPQTLQLFALSYFVGIFGFPLVAGWAIVEQGTAPLLWGVAALATLEASLAARRARARARTGLAGAAP